MDYAVHELALHKNYTEVPQDPDSQAGAAANLHWRTSMALSVRGDAHQRVYL